MAYEPTQWRSGDTITSERLNKMEQGIASSGDFYAIESTETNDGNDNYTFSDVTLRENGIPMFLIIHGTNYDGVGILLSIYSTYYVYGNDGNNLYVMIGTGEVTTNNPEKE